MKKFFLLLLGAVFFISINANADSTAKCLLHHQGTVQVFDGDKIEAAIKASADGDTIYLGEGTYPGFTLNKKITVRGAGEDSRINGAITVSISNNPMLTQTLLEWLNLLGNDVSIETTMKKVKIKQCKFRYLKTTANNVEDVLVDRCYVTSSISNFKSATIVNSKIGSVGSGNDGHEYLNCNIYSISNSLTGKYANCIIYNKNNYTTSVSNSHFKNCLFSYTQNLNPTSSAKDCWSSSAWSMYVSYDCSWNKYDLESRGYIGTDGTVVGIEGGSTPFTLEPTVPKVTNSTVHYDAASKMLKVNLTVTTNNE